MNKKKSKNLINPIQEKLRQFLNAWDPIGILPFNGGPIDEYDCLLKPIISLLRDKANKETMITFLREYLKTHLGLNPKFDKKFLNFVNELFFWWEKLEKDRIK